MIIERNIELIKNNTIICNFTPYNEKERAKEILFKKANFEDFEIAFTYNNKKYYKKIR